MEVIICNLSANISKIDLLELLKSFRKYMELKMVNTHYEDGSTFHFAVATFKADKQALKVIKKFNGALFKGERLVVREYIHRSYNNEKRALNWRQRAWQSNERRCHDRRRKEMVLKQDDPFAESVGEKSVDERIRVSGYRHLARKG